MKISSNYAKGIKILKVSILVVTLILTQIFLVLFYGNDMLFEEMLAEGVPLTQFYVSNAKNYGLPGNFIEYASSVEERFNIKSIKETLVFASNTHESNMYLLKARDSSYTKVEGKPIEDLSGDEMAVSTYYAYRNFGSIKKAIGKTIKVPISYKITENAENSLLAKPIYLKDELEFKIAAVYHHSGLEKRYLNYLSNTDELIDSGKVMYTNQSFVNDRTFDKLIETYEEDVSNGYNTVTQYQFIFNEYSKETEHRLDVRLRFGVKNYDTNFIHAECTYDLFRNSENINNTTVFMNAFQFISLYLLMFSTMVYLIYLQHRYTIPSFNTLYKIGYKSSKRRLGRLYHELYLLILGVGIWLAGNLFIHLIFGYKVIYVQDLYRFNIQIFLHGSVVAVLFYFIIVLLHIVFNYGGNKVESVQIKKSPVDKEINKRFYMERFLKLDFNKYGILLLITSISWSGFFIANHMVNTLVNIYKDANVLKYDVAAKMTGKAFTSIQEDIKEYAIIRPESNNFFLHKYDNEEMVASYKGSVVWLFGDVEKFLDPPQIGDFPDFENNPTLKDFIEKYPYYLELGDKFKQHYEDNKNMPFEFRIWITRSIAEKLHAEVGSFVESFVAGGFVNDATYPVAGITNIFSNNGDTIYILPSPSKGAVWTGSIKNKKYENNVYNVIMNLKEDVFAEDFIRKLQEIEGVENLEDIIVNRNGSVKKSIGALNNRVNKFIMAYTFTMYSVLLVALYICKKEDDSLSQSKNMKAYYNMGLDSKEAIESRDILNGGVFVLGVTFGYMVSILLNFKLTDILYDLMQVIK